MTWTRRWSVLALVFASPLGLAGTVAGQSDSPSSTGASPAAPLALTVSIQATPSVITRGQSVTFKATASGGVPPYSYAWDFADGETGYGTPITHVFTTASTFKVVCTAYDSSVLTGQGFVYITVNPGISLTVNVTAHPATQVVGQPVSFSASASGGTPPYTYTWDFGDGVSGSGASTSHTYGTPRTYKIYCTAADSASHTGQTSINYQITPAIPLSVGLWFSPSLPTTGTLISFVANAEGGTPPYRYSWDFADGSYTSGASVTHTYASPNRYQVKCTVVDSASSSIPGSIYVNVTQGVTAARFHTLAPCRVLDTRDPAGTFGGPALPAGGIRLFPIAQQTSCAVPGTAKAISINVTAVTPASAGDLILFPGGETVPIASGISFSTGRTRANNAVTKVGSDGSASVNIKNTAASPVHVLVDVNGYFQ